MPDPDFDKTVFVIMPFGEEGTKDREQNDDTYENIIKMAVESSGLDITCIRSDDICLPGGVMEDVITYAAKSKYVIADLSDGNSNVFYELGIRDSFDGKTILLCRKGQKLPFDLKDMRTVFYSKDLVKESSKAIEKIRTYLTNMEGSDKRILSPVQRALGLRARLESRQANDKVAVGDVNVIPCTSGARFDKTLGLFLSRKGLRFRTIFVLGDEWPAEFAYYDADGSSGDWGPGHVTAVRRVRSFDADFQEIALDVLNLVSLRVAKTSPSCLEILLVIEESPSESTKLLEELAEIIEANFTLLEPRSNTQMKIAKPKSLPAQANVETLVLTISIFDQVCAAEFEAGLGII